jgi:hypothetical protein
VAWWLMQHLLCPWQVAKALVSMFQECSREDYSSVQRLQAQEAARKPSGAAASKRQVVRRQAARLRLVPCMLHAHTRPL